jgi:transmembrane sensor
MLISKKSIVKNIVDTEFVDRFLKGQCSVEEQLYIQDFFRDDKKANELEKLLRRQWYKQLQDNDYGCKNLDHILYKIHYDINSNSTLPKGSLSNLIIWFSRIAAIIILPLTIFFGIHFFKTESTGKMSWVEIKAPAWSRVQFSLPDGTTGWLNSNSSIKYKGNFINDRKITLSGEAFFDVFRNEKTPFIVTADKVSLKVLGTKFNIASYENEKNVEVVLEEGELVFAESERSKSYTLKPNDLVVYNKNLNEFSTEVVEPQKYLSWTEGKLVFRNDPLDVVGRRIARWYNIDVEVNARIKEDLRLRATFVDDDLKEVLDILKRCFPINYRIENGTLKPDGTYARAKVIITPGNR